MILKQNNSPFIKKENELKVLNDEISLKTKKEEIKQKNDDSSIIIESLYIINSSSINYEEEKKISEEKENKENFNILEFIKIIGRHGNPVECIKEVGKKFFISCGTDGKIIVFNRNFIKMKEKIFYNRVHYISELRHINQSSLDLLACTKDALYLFRINESLNKVYCYSKVEGYSFFQKIDNDCYLISKNGESFLVSNLFSNISLWMREIPFINMHFAGGIQINKYCTVLTSNSIIPYGENKLLVFDYLTKKICYEISGYSFLPSSNGLTVISKNENKILLCACKKYSKFYNNGIFLINFHFDEERGLNAKSIFYDTKDFEVLCFCQIFVNDKFSNRIFEEYKYKYETNYFFVGGFDKRKGVGMIRLYKILDDKDFLDTKIEYIQNIEIEKTNEFKGFRGPISSIIQSKINGKILLTCWDGNIYLFNLPNLHYFNK